jgi:hypothetical protein
VIKSRAKVKPIEKMACMKLSFAFVLLISIGYAAGTETHLSSSVLVV